MVEHTAAQLSLLMEFEDERILSGRLAADLSLWSAVQACLRARPVPPLVLRSLVETCTASKKEGGLGVVFAVLGKLQSNQPVVRPSLAASEERLLVLSHSGDPAWAHSGAGGPLEALWREAIKEGHVIGADAKGLPLAKGMSRIVAVPIVVNSETCGVLLAGIPRHSVGLETLERLEFRAQLAAQVLESTHQAELELRARSWQSALLDSTDQPVVLVDRQGFVHGMSRGARELLHQNQARPEGRRELRRFAELFRPRQWEEIHRWMNQESHSEQTGSTEALNAELWNGRPVEIRCLSNPDSEYLAVSLLTLKPAGSARDITEVEAELRQSLEWLQEGVVIFDELGRIRAINSRCKQILGIATEGEREVRDFDELLALVSANVADSVAFARNWRALAADGGMESQDELAVEWPVPQVIQRSIRPILSEHGRKIGRVEVYQELTARKIFQSRMVQTEKLASLGQRATGIVHELANPLTTILGNAQRLVLGDTAVGSSPEVLRILEEAERAAAILRQLLYLSRDTQPSRHPISLSDLAERTIALHRMALHASSIELRFESESSIPPIDADFSQLQQVLLNLLQNSQQAIEQSGKGSRILVRVGRSGGDHVRLEVTDNGPGVPNSVSGRIYDPFFTTKPVGAGTGLGLSIALGFVRQNGGTLTHLSPKHGGSTFVMEFPVADEFAARGWSITLTEALPTKKPKPVETAAAVGLDRPLVSSQRILIVEDEPTVAALIADVLREAGLRADVMLESHSALQQLQRESYNLLICDLNMPGIDGQTLYRAMLDRHHLMRGKVLFVTGDIVAPRSQEFLARHRLPHVAKPFRMEELMRAVNELLQISRPVEAIPVREIQTHLSGNE